MGVIYEISNNHSSNSHEMKNPFIRVQIFETCQESQTKYHSLLVMMNDGFVHVGKVHQIHVTPTVEWAADNTTEKLTQIQRTVSNTLTTHHSLLRFCDST